MNCFLFFVLGWGFLCVCGFFFCFLFFVLIILLLYYLRNKWNQNFHKENYKISIGKIEILLIRVLMLKLEFYCTEFCQHPRGRPRLGVRTHARGCQFLLLGMRLGPLKWTLHNVTISTFDASPRFPAIRKKLATDMQRAKYIN